MSCRAALVGFATVLLSTVLAADPPTPSDTAPGARIGGSSRDGHLGVRETVLARFDAEANRDTLLVDRGTARRVLWISGRDRAQRLVVDGSPGPVFQEIPFTRGRRIGPFHGVLSERGSPNVALDGSRVAYVAKRDKKWFVTVDGKEYGPYRQYYAPSMVLSPDGRRVAWTTNGRDGITYVVDGVPHGPYALEVDDPYETVWEWTGVVFSPDSRRVTFRVPVRNGKRTDLRIVVDGEPGLPHRWTGRPQFSADGRHLAYWAREQHGKELHLMVDGRSVATASTTSREAFRTLDTIQDSLTLPFAPDASRLAYVTQNDNQLVPVIHGKDGPRCVQMGPIAFSADLSRHAYLVGKVKTGQTIFRHAVATLFLAHSTEPALKWGIVVDGVEHSEYPEPASQPVFAPDGDRLAYISKKQTVVVDGVEGPKHSEVRSLAFSPNGRHIAYVAKTKGGWHLFADGVEGPAFADIGTMWPAGKRDALTFTPDGGHFVYRVVDSGRQKVVVGTLGVTPPYDEVFDIIVFDRPGTFAFVAVRGDEVLRVEVDVPRTDANAKSPCPYGPLPGRNTTRGVLPFDFTSSPASCRIATTAPWTRR